MIIGNDAGVLGRICTLIGEKKANISDLEFVDRKPDFYRLMINVELRDVEQLHSLLLTLEAESHVAEVVRFREQPMKRTIPG
jgi:GTP pyrophosphokinase